MHQIADFNETATAHQNNEELLVKAKTLEEFEDVLDKIFVKYGIKPEKNAVFISISCPDDQSSSVLSHVVMRNKHKEDTSQHYLVYNRCVFGGIFVPGFKTFESLIPATHHIPNDAKNVVVLNFTHIGYDEESKKWGEFKRYGHNHTSASCGAIVTLYNLIKQNKDIGLQDEDLKELGMFLRNLLLKEPIEEKEDGSHILELTLKAFDEQSKWLIEELKKLSKKESINVFYLGGLEVDTNKDGKEFNDLIFLKKAAMIRDGEVEEITYDEM
ncbi:MAG: hypothetical protein GXN99_01805 [Candidatus Nanohaloarchaeota archaeon]|nr:hypothetical protein [Candidatus Nanohaloarchaeota archaeon]